MSLSARLGSLTVRVARAEVLVRVVPVPGYAGGRPTSELRLYGPEGLAGAGEHVGWSGAVHEAFARDVAARSWAHEGTVRELAELGALGHPAGAEEARYRRAALEGALLDLAFRQANCSLSALLGRPPAAPVRYLFSFDATRATAEHVASVRARNPAARFKLDVDPAWTEREVAALASLACVETFDGKHRGDRALWALLRARFPHALFEDPPREFLDEVRSGPTSEDQTVVTLEDVQRACAAGAAVNVKAPRMGGFLAALDALERARAAGRLAYVGGMFEVSVGRAQARCLAALCTPEGPNDLAPLFDDPTLARVAPSPLSIDLGAVGFGVP